MARREPAEGSEVAGQKDGKNKKGVLTGARVWGWTGREALAGTGVCFCSDDCKEKRRMIEKGS